MIRKIAKNKWRLYSKDGSKNLGTFNSLEGAKKHEREVQYFKHHESVLKEFIQKTLQESLGDFYLKMTTEFFYDTLRALKTILESQKDDLQFECYIDEREQKFPFAEMNVSISRIDGQDFSDRVPAIGLQVELFKNRKGSEEQGEGQYHESKYRVYQISGPMISAPIPTTNPQEFAQILFGNVKELLETIIKRFQ